MSSYPLACVTPWPVYTGLSVELAHSMPCCAVPCQAHGLERVATLNWVPGDYTQYQPRAVHGRPFVPDAAIFHFLRPR